MIDSELVGSKGPLVRSDEERRWLFEEPTQSRISPSMLEYTKMMRVSRASPADRANMAHTRQSRLDCGHGQIVAVAFRQKWLKAFKLSPLLGRRPLPARRGLGIQPLDPCGVVSLECRK